MNKCTVSVPDMEEVPQALMSPGVYAMTQNKSGQVVYVGSSSLLLARLGAQARKGYTLHFKSCRSRQEALRLEKSIIAHLNPIGNVNHAGKAYGDPRSSIGIGRIAKFAGRPLTVTVTKEMRMGLKRLADARLCSVTALGREAIQYLLATQQYGERPRRP